MLINQPLNDGVVFKMPEVQTLSQTINRPELKLYDVQKNSSEIQNRLLKVKNMPRISLFLQGGYGRPTLNMLDNDFGTYYIGGLRFSWNLTGFYTYKNEKSLQGIQQNLVDLQKEVFVFNTSLLIRQQSSEVQKLSELVLSDQQIILLRDRIKTTSAEQLNSGSITTNDYLMYVNAADQARQNLVLHQIQLLMAQYQHQSTSGN